MMSLRLRQALREARRRGGSISILTIFFAMFLVVTLIPSLYSTGLLTSASANAATSAQQAAYAASSALADGASRLTIDPAQASARADQIVRANLADIPVDYRIKKIDVVTHNVDATVAVSRQLDPSCSNPAYCWKDSLVGAYHRAPGVSVTVELIVNVCSTWNPDVGHGNGCFDYTVIEHGFSEYTTEAIGDPSDVTFAIDGPPATGNGDTAAFNWSLTGGFKPLTIQCIVDGKISPLSCSASGTGVGARTFTSLAIGSHTFQLRVTNSSGRVVTSPTWRWKITNVDSRPPLTIRWSSAGFAGRRALQGTFNVAGPDFAPSASYCTWEWIVDNEAHTWEDTDCIAADANGQPFQSILPASEVIESGQYKLTVHAFTGDGREVISIRRFNVAIGRTWSLTKINAVYRATSSDISSSDMEWKLSLKLGDTENLYNIDLENSTCALTPLQGSPAKWIHSNCGLGNARGNGNIAIAVTLLTPGTYCWNLNLVDDTGRLTAKGNFCFTFAPWVGSLDPSSTLTGTRTPMFIWAVKPGLPADAIVTCRIMRDASGLNVVNVTPCPASHTSSTLGYDQGYTWRLWVKLSPESPAILFMQKKITTPPPPPPPPAK